MRIATNVTAMVGQHQLGNITNRKALVSRQIASGDRICQASVDPAGLAISEKMKAYIRSNEQARRNTNDALAVLQIAESTLGVGGDLAIRMKELAIQAANDTWGPSERDLINREFQALKTEIIRSVKVGQYNGEDVVYDNPRNYDFQIGTGDSELDRMVYKIGQVLTSLKAFNFSSLNTATETEARSSIGSITKILDGISEGRAYLGSCTRRLDSVIASMEISHENISGSNSRIRDTDLALATATSVSAQIQEKANVEMLKVAQRNPNAVMKLLS
jgi:flagellin